MSRYGFSNEQNTFVAQKGRRCPDGLRGVREGFLEEGSKNERLGRVRIGDEKWQGMTGDRGSLDRNLVESSRGVLGNGV